MPPPSYRSGQDLVARLRAPEPLWAVELRPPRREVRQGREVEAWIDLHHALRGLLAEDTLVLVTDSATGTREEESLRHLQANVGADADLSRVVPFLTVKHPLEYCLRFPERATVSGHRGLVVLGGDTSDGVPRCVAHAAELRRMLRERQPGLALGGWANPYRDAAWQVDLLKRDEAYTDFILTQVVSHHDLDQVARFLEEAARARLQVPLLVGVFFYRSGNPKTLEALRRLIPVPLAGLGQEFAAGLDPVAVCRRTLEGLIGAGVRHFYLCNLPAPRARALLAELRGAPACAAARQPL